MLNFLQGVLSLKELTVFTTSYVFFGYCWNTTFPKPGSFCLVVCGEKSAPLFPYSLSSQILIGELVKRMSIISDSQEDVRNLCQPRDGGRDGAWRPRKVPLQRAGLRKLHREEVPCNLLSRASAASSLYEYQSHTAESSIL